MAQIFNKVEITKGGTTTSLTQPISTNNNRSKIISIKDDAGTELFKVERQPSGDIKLSFDKSASFVDANGAAVTPPHRSYTIKAANANNVLKFCEHKNPNGIMTAGQELEFQVDASVKIKANARGIELDDGGVKAFCNAGAGKSLGMNVSNNAIHDWLEGTNGFEKATDINASFPLPVLGLYIQDRIYSQVAPHNAKVGNFEFQTLPNPNNASDPYVFVKNKGKTCLYAKGQLKKVTEFVALHDAKTNKDFFAILNGSATYFRVYTDNASALTSESSLRRLGIDNVTDMSKAVTGASGVAFEDADSRKTKVVNFALSSATFKISEDPLDAKISDILMLINIFKEEIIVIINAAGEKVDENLQKILIKLGEHEDLLKKILAQTEQNGADIKKIDAAVALLGTALDKILANQDKLEGIVTGIDEQVKANSEELKAHGLKIDEILGIVKGLEGVPGKLGEIEKKLFESIKSNDENFEKVFEELATLKENQAEMRKSLDEILEKLSAIDTLSDDMKKLVDNLNQFKTEVNQRFDKLEQRIDNLEKTFKTELEGVNKRLDKLDENQVKIYNLLTQMGINVETLVTKTGELDLSVKNIEKILTTLSTNFDAYAKRTDKQIEQLLKLVGLNTEAINETKKLVESGVEHIVSIDEKVENLFEEHKQTNKTLESMNQTLGGIEEGQQKTNEKVDAVGDKVTHLENTVADLLTTVIFLMGNNSAAPGMTINNTTVTNNTTNNTTNDVDIYVSSSNIINQTKQNLMFLTAHSNSNVQGIISSINQSFDNISVCIEAIKNDESKTLNLMTDIKSILQDINNQLVDLKKENISPIITTIIEQQINNVTVTVNNIESSYNKNERKRVEAERIAALPDNAITKGFDIEAFSKRTLSQMLEDYYKFFDKMIADEGASEFHIVNKLSHKARQKILDIKKAIKLQQQNLKKLYVQLGKYNDNPSEDTKKEILKLIRELRLNQQELRDYKDQLKGIDFFDDKELKDAEIKKQMDQMSDAIDKKTDKVLEKAEDMQKEKEEEKKDEGPEEKKHEHKKTVEYLSNSLFPLAAVFIALACLTPLGIFALIPGIALAGACVLGNVYAEKFNYSTWEYAHKQLTEQEQQELEDQEQLGKFMEKQAELEKMEEKINLLAHGGEVEVVDENGNVQKVRQDGLQQSFEDQTLDPLMSAYNQYGIGFNATSNPENNKRSEQLLGIEGHQIREGMHEQLAIITDPNTPEPEREIAINKFIDDNFAPDMPAEDRQKIFDLMKSDKPEDKKALRDMTTRMGYLNREEEQYLALLSETKVDISRMPDYLIAKALGSPELDNGNRRAKFIDRYGPTLVRRYAINEGLSQAKLDMLFSEVPESVKPQCVEQMLKIAEGVFNSIEALEKFSAESKQRHNSINLAKIYGHSIAELSIEPNQYYTRQDARDALTTVVGLEIYRDQLKEINKTDSKLDACKVGATVTPPSKSVLAVDKLKEIQPVDDEGLSLSDNYKIIYECAVELGIKEILMTFGEMGGSSPIDRDIDTIIIGIIQKHETNPKLNSHPTFIKLKNAVNKVNSPDIEKNITYQSFIEFKKILAKNVKGSTAGSYNNNVNIRFNEIQQARQKCIDEGKEYTGEYSEITDETALKAALFCELFINNQSGEEKEKYQKIFNLIKSGEVARANKRRAKNKGMADGLGITPEADIDAQIERETEKGNKILHGAYLTEDMLQRFPQEDRQDIANRCQDKILAGGASTPFNQILRLVLIEKYGKETTPDGKTYEDILKECTDNSTGTPRIDPDKLDETLDDLEAILNTLEEQECSCCEMQLGKRLTRDIHEEILKGGSLDAADSANLSREVIDQERKAEKTLQLMTTLREEFEECWARARNAKNEKDLEPLKKLLLRPANTALHQVYEKKIELLKKLGIEVDQIIQELNNTDARLSAATSDEEKNNIIQGTAETFENQEQMYGFVLTSKELLATQIKNFDAMKMMHRATDKHDRETIAAMNRLETAVDEATTVSAKLRMVHMLAREGKISEAELKEVLRNFARGNFGAIISPHLRGLRFSRNDPATLAKIGITPENIADLTLEEITEKVKKYIEEQSADYKRLSETSSGKAERGQEKADGEIQPTSPRKIKNRVSLVSRIFGNIKESDRLSREKRAELERLGLDKTATYNLEAEAGEHTLEDEVKEDGAEAET